MKANILNPVLIICIMILLVACSSDGVIVGDRTDTPITLTDTRVVPTDTRISLSDTPIPATATAMPQSLTPTNTTTAIATPTPTVPTLDPSDLNKNDLSSVIHWFTYLVEYQRPELITYLIGSNGTAFVPYELGARLKGYNNGDEIFEIMDKTLSVSKPACLGYNPNFGAAPDKAIIFFQGIDFNWSELGLSNSKSDVNGFTFFYLDQGWELIYIANIPDWGVPEPQSLVPCPET